MCPCASHRLEFLVPNRRAVAKKTEGLVNKFLIDCCVCIQRVILKINSNKNKNVDWVIFTCFLCKYCLTPWKLLRLHWVEDCCVCENSVIFSFFPFCFFFFFACRIVERLKSWYLIDLFNKCYIDVKDCINCRDSIGKTLYRCNLLHNTSV